MKRSDFLKTALGGLCAGAAGLSEARAQGTVITADLARWKSVTDRVAIQLD